MRYIRYIRYAFLAVIGIVLITIALANRGFVTVGLVPEELGDVVPIRPEISLPMYLVIFASILAGFAVGYIWEWLREFRVRSEAAEKGREVRRLERENRKLRTQKTENQGDEVLAILDEAS